MLSKSFLTVTIITLPIWSVFWYSGKLRKNEVNAKWRTENLLKEFNYSVWFSQVSKSKCHSTHPFLSTFLIIKKQKRFNTSEINKYFGIFFLFFPLSFVFQTAKIINVNILDFKMSKKDAPVNSEVFPTCFHYLK